MLNSKVAERFPKNMSSENLTRVKDRSVLNSCLFTMAQFESSVAH